MRKNRSGTALNSSSHHHHHHQQQHNNSNNSSCSHHNISDLNDSQNRSAESSTQIESQEAKIRNLLKDLQSMIKSCQVR